MKLHAVFAYGSNMCAPDLERWLLEKGHGTLSPRAVHRALLLDHRLVWNYRSPARRGGAANVEAAPGEHLPGVVLRIDDALLRALDEKEGHPERYRRSERATLIGEARETAWVYEVTPAWRHAEPIWPRRSYVEVMVRGARAHGLPDDHIAKLDALPTVD